MGFKEDLGWVCDDCGAPKKFGGRRCRACYIAVCKPQSERRIVVEATALASGVSVDLEKLERAIVKPGFEKDLEPLLYFRSTRRESIGRMHRMWNYAVSGMLHLADCADLTQRLGNNPNFSQLCMPLKRPTAMQIAGFASRLRSSPALAKNHPELFDYVMETARHAFNLIPVLPESRYPTDIPWRTYVPSPRALRRSDGKPWGSPKIPTPKVERQHNPYEIAYPFIIHRAKTREADPLVLLLDQAVPRHLDRETRADLCQDLAVAILCGDLKQDDVLDGIKCYLPKVRKMFPTKYGPLSLDALIPGTESLRLIDTLADDHPHF